MCAILTIQVQSYSLHSILVVKGALGNNTPRGQPGDQTGARISAVVGSTNTGRPLQKHTHHPGIYPHRAGDAHCQKMTTLMQMPMVTSHFAGYFLEQILKPAMLPRSALLVCMYP